MHELLNALQKGTKVSVTATYEVMEINRKTNIITLRNLATGEQTKHSDWWFESLKQNGNDLTFTQ